MSPSAKRIFSISITSLIIILSPQLRGEGGLPEFPWGQFDEILKFAKNNHAEPSSYNETLGYPQAAQEALGIFQTPLILMPRATYERIQKRGDRAPNKLIEFSPAKEYVIMKVEESALRQNQKEKSKAEHVRLAALSPADRAAYVEKTTQELRRSYKEADNDWAATHFNRDDFKTVLEWVSAHSKEYRLKGDKEITKASILSACGGGFLKSMDPHSDVMEMAAWQAALKGDPDARSLEGVGMMLRGGGSNDVIVENPLDGGPARNAGIKAGDTIVTVDTKPIDGMTLAEVVKLIRGQRDTFATIEIQRPGIANNMTFRVRRAPVFQKMVSSRMIPDTKIGIIEIKTFLFNKVKPSARVESEFENLKKANGKLDGLILDLRGNSGGDFDEAIQVSSLFLPEGSVVSKVERKREIEERKGDLSRIVPDGFPIMVMIDAGSYGASEIVAAALMDHNVALVVGERSYGGGTLQGLQSRTDVVVKLTTARFFSPHGYSMQVLGITPDVPMSVEADGTFPYRFREEDHWRHFPKLTERKPAQAREAWIAKIRKISANNLQNAETRIKNLGAAREDYMLIRALAYFDALKENPKP